MVLQLDLAGTCPAVLGPQRELTALRRKGLRWHTQAGRRLQTRVSRADSGGSAPAESRLEPRAIREGSDPHQPWSGREWVGGGPARKPAFSRLPLSAKPIRLAVRQLVRLFCASQPRCEGFSLGKKAVLECLPRSNAREAQGPGIPEGD